MLAHSFLYAFHIQLADFKQIIVIQWIVGHHHGPPKKSRFEKIKQLVLSDLNTAEAIGLLSGLVSRAEDEGIDSERIQTLLDQLDQVFGLSLANREDIDAEIATRETDETNFRIAPEQMSGSAVKIQTRNATVLGVGLKSELTRNWQRDAAVKVVTVG